jgi:isopenicillin N synthase-like dioxygenase
MSKEIPVLDYTLLSSNPAKFVQDLKQAASEWGFFFLKNHNIPQSEVDKNFALAEKFFHGPNPGDEFKINKDNVGYSGRWQEGYGMDDHISYNFSGRYRMPMTLPPMLAAEYDRIQEFKKSVWELALELLRGFAIALELEPEHFAKWHDLTKDPGMNLRFMYYPENHTPDEGQTRIREHSDFGTVTVLFQKDVGGLEVLSPSGTWVTAPVIPGAPLINIGDFLQVNDSYPYFYPRDKTGLTTKQIWSAGELKSTVHRLTFKNGSAERYSMPCFVGANVSRSLNLLC